MEVIHGQRDSINELDSLPNYNTATSGWVTKKVALTSYIGDTVLVRFAQFLDHGGFDIGLDNVTGPKALTPAYDDRAMATMLDFNGTAIINIFLITRWACLLIGVVPLTKGDSALTNVTLNVNVNNGTATGTSAPKAKIASGVTDTLYAQPTFPTTATPTEYQAQLLLTQKQITDTNFTGNIGDSITFYATPTDYFRSLNFNSVLSPYSFGTFHGNHRHGIWR